MKEFIFCGVGGQGVVLASRVLASYYSKKNKQVRTTETIGMAQMGGSVVSHLRVSDDVIYSPFVLDHGANIIFSFEPGEVFKSLDYANKNTHMIIYDEEIAASNDLVAGVEIDKNGGRKYLKENYNNIYYCNFDEIFKTLNNKKVLNTCILAYAHGLGILRLDEDVIFDCLKENIKDAYVDLNIQAYKMAKKLGENNRR